MPAERQMEPVAKRDWRVACHDYLNRRQLAILLMGFSSGLPLLLTLSTLSYWLSKVGIDKTSIGLFALVGLPYAFKFLWAPLLDHTRLPLLAGIFGHRRSWALVIQVLLMAAILAMGLSDPASDPWPTALAALFVAFFSASQDIVIDAYRVELLEEDKIGPGASGVVFGYRMGLLVSGAGALYLADQVSWNQVYLVMAALGLVGLITILVSREPDVGGSDQAAAHDRRMHEFRAQREGQAAWRRAVFGWLYGAVVRPLADFMARPQWLGILLFIAFYKFGDALAGVMTGPFMVELGFSNTEIANVGKIYGFGATLLGLGLGGALIKGLGLLPALWICGVLQMLSNLLFAVQATLGHDTTMLAVTVGAENLAGGMGTAAFVAYLTSLCNVAYTATQYALLSSFMAAARTFLSTPAGWFAEVLDWVPFFVMTTGAALPGLALLLWLTLSRRKIAATPAERLPR